MDFQQRSCNGSQKAAAAEEQRSEGTINLSYKNKDLCRIRTITTFLSLGKDRESWKKEVLKESHFCLGLSKEFNKNDYIVQSVRIVTNPFGEYLNTEDIESAKKDLAYLSKFQLRSSDTLLSGKLSQKRAWEPLCYWS